MQAIIEGNRALDAGDIPEAIRCYRKAAYQAPDHPEPRLQIGHAHMLADAPADALSEFEAASRLDPGSARALVLAALAAQRLGLAEEAIGYWRRAIALDPTRVAPRYALSGALGEAGELREAIREAQELLRIDPECMPAANNLAVMREAQGDREGAIALYERALRSSPGDLAMTYNLARLRARRGDFAQASDCLREVLEQAPEFGEAFALQGWIFLSQGLFAEAERAYRSAIRQGFDTPEARMGHVLAIRQIGGQDAARQALKELLETFPGYGPAQSLLQSET